MHAISKHQVLFRLGVCLATASFATGCDPTINLYGSFFPAWVICLAIGTAGTVLLRYLFARLRLERHLGPLILVYPCLLLLLSCMAWVVFFRR